MIKNTLIALGLSILPVATQAQTTPTIERGFEHDITHTLNVGSQGMQMESIINKFCIAQFAQSFKIGGLCNFDDSETTSMDTYLGVRLSVAQKLNEKTYATIFTDYSMPFDTESFPSAGIAIDRLFDDYNVGIQFKRDFEGLLQGNFVGIKINSDF